LAKGGNNSTSLARETGVDFYVQSEGMELRKSDFGEEKYIYRLALAEEKNENLPGKNDAHNRVLHLVNSLI
jgi:hypothetical protein